MATGLGSILDTGDGLASMTCDFQQRHQNEVICRWLPELEAVASAASSDTDAVCSVACQLDCKATPLLNNSWVMGLCSDVSTCLALPSSCECLIPGGA